MKSTFAIACMVAATSANLFDTAKEFMAEFPVTK
jgi:hypothetical protein